MTQKAPRPAVLEGKTEFRETMCGKLYVTVNVDSDGKPFEVFTNMGKAGGCASAQCESIGRLISYSLRIGGEVRDIIKELKGIMCHNKSDQAKSCADVIATVLQARFCPDMIIDAHDGEAKDNADELS